MTYFIQLFRWLTVASMKLDNTPAEDFRIFRLRLQRGLIYLMCVLGPLLAVSWLVTTFAK